jgi:uncharacterized membrane protein
MIVVGAGLGGVLKKGVILFLVVLFLVVLLCLIIASYLKSYYEVLNKAREYALKGEYELAMDNYEYAHRFIRGMFIALMIWVAAAIPIAYAYYITYVKKK